MFEPFGVEIGYEGYPSRFQIYFRASGQSNARRDQSLHCGNAASDMGTLPFGSDSDQLSFISIVFK